MFRIWFALRAFFRGLVCKRTYLWLDPRDGEWTVTHKGQDLSDLAAVMHEDEHVRHLGDWAYSFNTQRSYLSAEATENILKEMI